MIEGLRKTAIDVILKQIQIGGDASFTDKDTWEWFGIIKSGDGLKLWSLEVDLNAQGSQVRALFCPLHTARMVHTSVLIKGQKGVNPGSCLSKKKEGNAKRGAMKCCMDPAWLEGSRGASQAPGTELAQL